MKASEFVETEHEYAIIAAILLRGAVALDEADVPAADFGDGVARTVYQALVGLAERNEPIDTISLYDELQRRSQLKLVGNIAEVSALTDRYATSRHAGYHGRRVRELALARRLRLALRELGEAPPDELVGRAREELPG